MKEGTERSMINRVRFKIVEWNLILYKINNQGLYLYNSFINYLSFYHLINKYLVLSILSILVKFILKQ